MYEKIYVIFFVNLISVICTLFYQISLKNKIIWYKQ